MKKSVRVIALLLAMVLMTGCTLFPAKDSTKSISSNGLTMNIPSDYKDVSSDPSTAGYTFAYGNSKSLVVGLREEKSLFESYGYYLTLEEYGELVIEGNGIFASLNKENGIITFTFTRLVDGVNYKYLAGVYENNDCFWLIQFGCEMSNFSSMESEFMEYLVSVRP